jgi:Salmonella virulence plasmid 65kDa B protein
MRSFTDHRFIRVLFVLAATALFARYDEIQPALATATADLDPGAPILPATMPLPATPISVGASVGALPGGWEVPATGEFTYSIPLDVPAGRANMQPSLSLEYASGLSNGLMGVGWSLSGLSKITKCTTTIASDGVVGDWGDRLCLDGNRLVDVGGGSYRTEHETFVKITYDAANNAYTVQSKAGIIRTYTFNVDAWLLSKVEDASGNRMDYVYKTFDDASNWNASQVAPDHIDYTKHSNGAPAYRSITFAYEDLEPNSVLSCVTVHVACCVMVFPARSLAIAVSE